jgi:DNA-binding GntR family transcriptional regulator
VRPAPGRELLGALRDPLVKRYRCSAEDGIESHLDVLRTACIRSAYMERTAGARDVAQFERALPAKDVAYEYVRREILSGGDEEARFLAEETVGNSLGLSRTPVREAFLRLEAEGLLKLVPRKGAMIVPITSREVREVMEARSVVENWSVDKVLQDPTLRRQVPEEMRALHADLVALGHDEDAWTFIEADRRFHRTLVAGARNRVMLEMYERMRDLQLRIGVQAVWGEPERVVAVHGEHERIIAALLSGDAGAAHEAIEHHLVATTRSLRRS